MSKTVRLTMAQAIVRFLKNQYVERDGVEHQFFAGVFGIFGHGNVAGIGQALHENPDFRYHQTRNEQAMVHTAAGYAKMKNRLGTFVCTTSIGPGASNMITAAAGATINRVPVLLLPGDLFAHRKVSPVLQQLEAEYTQDISVNDCFKPISRYWDRFNRPEQAIVGLMEAMRVLTSPADTGAVTLCLPQDVQAEAYDYPADLFEKRVWTIPRARADRGLLARAAKMIRESKRPLIIAGGGVIYSEATETLAEFVAKTGIPVGETQAGKGVLNFDNPSALGAVGVTGTHGANIMAREADLVIGIGTRYTDFINASKTAFSAEGAQFININVAEFDAYKHGALPLTGDAKVTLEELSSLLGDYEVAPAYRARAKQFNAEWDTEVDRIYNLEFGPLMSQGELVGAVNMASAPQDVVVHAAGSVPGDAHKLWRTRNPKGYHSEYGYSCMGYEIAGALGAKMADPDREVYVLVGDGSYLMMAQEIITSVQEGYKLTIILINNDGYRSIGALSRSIGDNGFGTRYTFRDENGRLAEDDVQYNANFLPVDLAANAASLGADVIKAGNLLELKQALLEAKTRTKTTVIYTEVDRYEAVPGYETWWDVPIAQVAERDSVREVSERYEKEKKQIQHYL